MCRQSNRLPIQDSELWDAINVTEAESHPVQILQGKTTHSKHGKGFESLSFELASNEWQSKDPSSALFDCASFDSCCCKGKSSALILQKNTIWELYENKVKSYNWSSDMHNHTCELLFDLQWNNQCNLDLQICHTEPCTGCFNWV